MQRLTHLVMFSGVAAMVLVPSVFGADPSKQESHHSARTSVLPADDAQQIRGHWLCTLETDDGKESPFSGTVHAVFTDKEVKICGLSGRNIPLEYALNPKATPKRCEMTRREMYFSTPAIYDLQGDVLKLSIAKSSQSEYPDSFEPKDGRITYAFRRVEKVQKTANANTLSKEDTQNLESLRKEIEEQIQLLETKKYREVLERVMRPEDFERLKAENKEPASDAVIESRAAQWAGILRLILEAPVTLDTTKGRATFDTRGVHQNGMPGISSASFIKTGDHWYMEEDRR